MDRPSCHVLAVDLLARLFVYDHEPDARRRRDGSAVLVAEAAHSGALRLLYDNQPVKGWDQPLPSRNQNQRAW